MSARRGLGSLAAAALLGIPATLFGVPATLSGQQPSPEDAPPQATSFEVRVYQPAESGEARGGESPPARLGLYLVDWCFGASTGTRTMAVTRARARGVTAAPARATACERPPVVRVLVGGPAERAGVRPGDTLIAVDGERVTTPAGRRVVASLEPGVPVEVRVARSGERMMFEVTPEVLAAGGRIVRLAAPGAGAGGGPPATVRAVRIPEFSVRITYGGPPDPPSAGEPGSNPAEPGPIRVRSGRIIEFGPPVSPLEAERVYMWSDPGLAVRLEAVRESVTVRARVRLDSLLRFHRAHPAFPRFRVDSLQVMARRMARQLASLEQARVVVADQRGLVEDYRDLVNEEAAALRTERLDLFATRNRVAGAEFQPLGPELGEYFGDLRSGLLVVRVLHGTPAARLGLRPGDVITEAGGVDVDGVADLRRAFLIRDSGVTGAGRGGRSGLEVRWVRKGEAMSGTLEL